MGAEGREDLAEGAGAHAVGFGVAGETFRAGVEGEFAAELPGDRGGVAGDVRVAHDVVIRGGEGAGFHAVEKIARVAGWVGAAHGEGAPLAAERGGVELDGAVVAPRSLVHSTAKTARELRVAEGHMPNADIDVRTS